jgi:biopolymer transport protein ExbD
MNIRRKLKAHSEIHTGPLNDILFILLLFFLIAATLANPNLVRVNNPKGTKDTKTQQHIVVSIDKENRFYIGSKPVESIQLDTMLKLEIDAWRLKVDTPQVIVNADTASSTGQIFRVMSIVKQNKPARFSFHVK